MNEIPDYSFTQTAPPILLAGILFVALIIVYKLAHRFRQNQIRRDPAHNTDELKTINGMLLALLGLILAFTFSMANDRYNTRRALLIDEANYIGTVIQQLDVLPDSVRMPLRSSMKQYLEERIAFYETRMDYKQAAVHYFRADSISNAVWNSITAFSRVDKLTVIASNLVPAFDLMTDIVVSRRAAGEATLPSSILFFLFSLCLGAAFLIGYDHKGPINWVVVITFALMLSATIFSIIDLDRPRSGLNTLDGPHQRMVDLRKMF